VKQAGPKLQEVHYRAWLGRGGGFERHQEDWSLQAADFEARSTVPRAESATRCLPARPEKSRSNYRPF